VTAGADKRVLALDYGSARCGCAVSDPTGVLATPVEPVLRPRTRAGLKRLRSLVESLGVERVVVGLPLSLSGEDSAQTAETRAFADELERVLPVPVELYDERLTTALATRMGGTASEDSRAAAHLLETWLAANDGDSVRRGRTESPKFGETGRG
jgi:putative Holliday junction resolvase